MTSEQFDNEVKLFHEWQNKTLLSKAGEYATEDRLHNFKVIAQLTGLTPDQVASVLMLKNLVSFLDDQFGERKKIVHNEGFRQEKLGDPYNYLVLIQGLLEDAKIEQNDDMAKKHPPFHWNETKDSYDYWSERYQAWFDINTLIDVHKADYDRRDMQQSEWKMRSEAIKTRAAELDKEQHQKDLLRVAESPLRVKRERNTEPPYICGGVEPTAFRVLGYDEFGTPIATPILDEEAQ